MDENTTPEIRIRHKTEMNLNDSNVKQDSIKRKWSTRKHDCLRTGEKK